METNQPDNLSLTQTQTHTPRSSTTRGIVSQTVLMAHSHGLGWILVKIESQQETNVSRSCY